MLINIISNDYKSFKQANWHGKSENVLIYEYMKLLVLEKSINNTIFWILLKKCFFFKLDYEKNFSIEHFNWKNCEILKQNIQIIIYYNNSDQETARKM